MISCFSKEQIVELQKAKEIALEENQQEIEKDKEIIKCVFMNFITSFESKFPNSFPL